jgi:hypothetical protein
MMKVQNKFLFKMLALASSTFLMTGCFEQNFSILKSTPVAATATTASSTAPTTTISTIVTSPLAPTVTPTASPTATPGVVCDPFDTGGTTTTSNSGLKAQMFYFNDSDLSSRPHAQYSDFATFGHTESTQFYFNNLNVPTRSFSSGFQLTDGSLLSTPAGTPLFEYFAFDFKSSIRLPAGTGVKQKQFALISDDGSNLLVQDPVSGVWSKSVANDDNHESLMGCGGAPVTLSSDYSTPIEVQYFQGPRYQIALILLWRDWNGSASDTYCGASGNTEFFDTSGQPTSAYNEILTRWQVVPADVFQLPAGNNPCN